MHEYLRDPESEIYKAQATNSAQEREWSNYYFSSPALLHVQKGGFYKVLSLRSSSMNYNKGKG